MDKILEIKNNLNCSLFIDKIYDILGINNHTKNIKIFNKDYIYLEREYPDIDNIKIFSVSYFYKNHDKRYQYIESLIENLNKINDYFSDFYIFLHIDLSVLNLIQSEDYMNKLFKTLCLSDKLYLQFYHCNNNIINYTDYKHNNTFGTLIKHLPLILKDNISFCFVVDIESYFVSYFHKLLYDDFINISESIFLMNSDFDINITNKLFKSRHHYLFDNKQYIINNTQFMGSILGYKNCYNSDIMKIYFNIFKKFIQNDIKDIIYHTTHNYEYGIDELILLYFYYYTYTYQNNLLISIKIYGKFDPDLFVYDNLLPVFNYFNYLDTNSMFDTPITYIKTFFIIYFYNIDYIKQNKYLYDSYIFIFDSFNMNINDIDNYINKIKKSDKYIFFYRIYNKKSYDDLIKYIINSIFYYNIHFKKYVNIKFINYYK